MSQPTATDRSSPAPDVAPLDVPVTLTVELGRVNLTLSRLADLKPGDVVELSRHSRTVELTSNGRLVRSLLPLSWSLSPTITRGPEPQER